MNKAVYLNGLAILFLLIEARCSLPPLEVQSHQPRTMALPSFSGLAKSPEFEPPFFDTPTTEVSACTSDYPKRGMPNFKQCDPEWKCFPFAGHAGLSTCSTTNCSSAGGADELANNICRSGCGITSGAMMLSFFGHVVRPPDVATWLVAAGYRDDLGNITGSTCDGVTHEAICAVGRHWGLECQQTSSFNDVDVWLRTGPVTAHVRHRNGTPHHSCKFTTAGHYIVMTALDETNRRYSISDPNSCENSRRFGTAEELSQQCELVGFVRLIFGGSSRAIASRPSGIVV